MAAEMNAQNGFNKEVFDTWFGAWQALSKGEADESEARRTPAPPPSPPASPPPRLPPTPILPTSPPPHLPPRLATSPLHTFRRVASSGGPSSCCS